jgi:hypothetical protein
MLAGALLLVLAGCATGTAEDGMGSPVESAPVMRGSRPPAAARPVPPTVYRVANGSAGVLARFPKGTQVTLQTEICLKAGEQVTVSGSNGQSVTYNRPGCLKRDGRPTGENAGGFTFGWAVPNGRADLGAAK